jgi:hypothetical protein
MTLNVIKHTPALELNNNKKAKMLLSKYSLFHYYIVKINHHNIVKKYAKKYFKIAANIQL